MGYLFKHVPGFFCATEIHWNSLQNSGGRLLGDGGGLYRDLMDEL